jgi:DNA replication protein DnaC
MPNNKTYPFESCLEFLEKKGKELFSPGFKVHPEDYEIIFKLLVYFVKDQPKADKYGLSFRKGILLSGPVGCGKTSLMSLFRFYLNGHKRHIMKSCREISFEFIQDGYSVIQKYSRNAFILDEPKIYCFDDLGTENNLKYFGNDCNVMAEVLLSRYDLFVSRKMTTHITTNLNSSEIEGIYGLRVRSRLREQFNLIAFDQSSKDKRV